MSHYYDKKQSGPLREEIFSLNILGRPFDFISASGIFSKAHLDTATKLLIEKCDLTGATNVLDLGCGWGAVAVILGTEYASSGTKFTASDVSERAIMYTRKNVRKYKLDVEVVESSLFEGLHDRLFDVILTNPPYVAGRETCIAFITESFDHLKKGGSLQLVARHQKGGKFLGEKMKETFGNMDALAKNSGFRIYKSVKE